MRRVFYLLASISLIQWAGAEPSSAPAFTVVIDAGHGGENSGVTRETLFEDQLALAVAERVVVLAESSPHLHIVLTRYGDYSLSALERVRIANTSNAHAFISLHFAAGAQWSGPAIFVPSHAYFSGAPDSLAPKSIVPIEEVPSAWNLKSHELANALREAFQTGFPGTQKLETQYSLLALRGVNMPAVLIELDTLRAETADDWKQGAIDRAAAAIMDGLISYRLRGAAHTE